MASSVNRTLERRFHKILKFLSEAVEPPAKILDLGTPNELGHRMISAGFSVSNTEGDLESMEAQLGADADVVTALEILEHLVSPANILRAIRAPRLLATVPLRLWFSSAYCHPSDPWDRHFHEFEDSQFDWLLEHSGWKIVRAQKWTSTAHAMESDPYFGA